MSDFISKNKVFVSTVACGAIGAGLYYYFSQVKGSGFDSPYPKTVVIDVLKDFRREFNKVNVALFQQVSRVKQFLRANGRQFDSSMKDEFQAMLVDNNPEFTEQMEEVEERVYAKHGITDKVRFQKSCELTYKLDPEVSALMKGMHKSFDSVMGGETPQVDAVVPPEMTPELTLSIVTKSAEEYLKAFLNLAEQFMKKGEKPNQNNLNFLNSLRSISPEEFKMKNMRDRGLERLSDDPEAMFSKAIQTYLERDQAGFRTKLFEIENRNKAVMSSVLNGVADLDMIEKFRQELYAPAKDAIAEATPQQEEENDTDKPEGTDAQAGDAVEGEMADGEPVVDAEAATNDQAVDIKPEKSVVLNSNQFAESTNEDTLGQSQTNPQDIPAQPAQDEPKDDAEAPQPEPTN